MSNEPLISRSSIVSYIVAVALFIAGCDAMPDAAVSAAASAAVSIYS